MNNLELQKIIQTFSRIIDSNNILIIRSCPTSVNPGPVSNSAVSFYVGPTTIYNMRMINISGGNIYVKLYDEAAPGDVNPASSIPKDERIVSNNTNGAPTIFPVRYTKGVQVRVVTGFADTDNTAPANTNYILEFTHIPG